MTGLGVGVLRGQAGRLVSRSVKSFVSRVWTAPGIQIPQAGSSASKAISMKDTSCQSLCEEQQEETRKERVELSLSIPPMVSGRTMTSEPQESAHCPSNFADDFWKRSHGCVTPQSDAGCMCWGLPSSLNTYQKPWPIRVSNPGQLQWSRAGWGSCVTGPRTAHVWREAHVQSGWVSQTGCGDNSLLYVNWASVPNSIFLSLSSLWLYD